MPRNTSVIVRRLPASRPGKGTAQRYVLGVLPTDGQGVKPAAAAPGQQAGGAPKQQFNPGRNMVLNARGGPSQPNKQQQSSQEEQQDEGPKDDSEEARINAMFQQTTDQWGAMQERLAE